MGDFCDYNLLKLSCEIRFFMVLFTFILRSDFKKIEFTFLAVQDSSIGDLVTHSLSESVSHVLISATSESTAELS